MINFRAFHVNKVRYFLPLSIVLNLILIGAITFSLIESKQLSEELLKIESQTTQNQKLEKSRMNGTIVSQTGDNINFDEMIDSKELNEFNTNKLSGFKFSKFTYDYKTTIDVFSAEVENGISITIEKIENSPPYLARFSPSEWSGVMSIEDLVEPIIGGNVDPKLYNVKINDMNFARSYKYYPGFTKLQYATVVESKDMEHLYYLTFNSDWEAIDRKSVDPVEWFSKHPSEKFEKLETFMKDIVRD